jgi:hypothetical protein
MPCFSRRREANRRIKIRSISMGDTTNSPKPAFLKPAFLGTEFNAFLFAPIGADASGTYLTVVSALARLDLDPWAEAASLARLPGSIATQKLAELVSRFPEIPLVHVESAKIATRLTALLPGTVRSKNPLPSLSVQALRPAAQTLMTPRSLFFLMSLTLGVMVVTQLIIAPVQLTNQIKSAAQAVMHHGAQIKPPPAVVRMSTNQ